jgi:hypothetical protein
MLRFVVSYCLVVGDLLLVDGLLIKDSSELLSEEDALERFFRRLFSICDSSSALAGCLL